MGKFEGIIYTIFRYKFESITVDMASNIIVILSISLVVMLVYIIYLIYTRHEAAEVIAHRMVREHSIAAAQLRQLYDESPVPYVTLMPDGTIHNPNAASLRLFGMTVNTLQGKNFFELQPEEDSEQTHALHARFHSTVPINREEVRIVRNDGSILWVMLSIFSFRVPGSRTRRGLATLVDITEQKNLDRAKTEFVSLASHQLRTPLSMVKWHAEVLLSGRYGNLNEKQQEYLSKLYRGNQIMIGLVETLLNISRIEMGTLPVHREKVDVSPIVESVLEELEPQIKEKSLVVQKQYKTSFVLESDLRLLRIVVQNLLSNAVKYTPEQGRVTIIFDERDGQYMFSVSDTGYGIPPEQQSMIFTKMFRAENIIKKDVGGTGLGLYLVKSIVETLNGSITFTSELNRGTTFTVLLP